MKIDAEFERRLEAEVEEMWSDGSLRREVERILETAPAPEGVDPDLIPKAASGVGGGLGPASVRTIHPVVQSVVNAVYSPSLLIRDGSFEAPASELWRHTLEPRRGALEGVIPAVGRIEVEHHPRRSWVGTGVLVADGVVVTNRHVALEMAAESAEGWVFAPGTGGRSVSARIDFRVEHGEPADEEFPLLDLLAVENESGPDLAFLRVGGAGALPSAANLGGTLEAQEAVAVIGYTSREPETPPAMEAILQRIFRNIYEVKRLAPGKVLGTGDVQISHDCSTLGGNSGSAVVELDSGQVAGIHFKGGLRRNYAIPAPRVRERLDALA